MALSSTLLYLLFTSTLAFANLLPADRTTGSPTEGKPEEGRKALMGNQDRQQRSLSSEGNDQCQEGDPPGENYSGKVSVTASGQPCKVWPAYIVMSGEGEGEGEYCRNPWGDSKGVFCFTIDEEVYMDYCAVPVCNMKVIDFSADNDHKPDSNGSYTSATLNVGKFPDSFTICSAFMVDSWSTGFTEAAIFSILDDEGGQWVYVDLYAARNQTEYHFGIEFDPSTAQTTAVFFPLQWTRVCLSLDSVSNKMTLVVNGQLLGEREYDQYDVEGRPDNLRLLVGSDCLPSGLRCYEIDEYTGRVSDINVFNSALSVERMVGLTTAGGKECGAAGDLVSWEEAEWTLHSQAEIIKMAKSLEDPCRRESTVQVFAAHFERNTDCMHHCPKIAGGRVPPVNTGDELESLFSEVQLIGHDRSFLASMWLSATEGDKEGNLEILDHWNEAEVIEAVETVWRDFYTGQQLENWTYPGQKWESNMRSGHDRLHGDTYNCMTGKGWKLEWEKSGQEGSEWHESECHADTSSPSCPCSYPAQPLLRLRGLCSASLIEELFSPKQLPSNPANMILLGKKTARIEYKDASSHGMASQWVLTDAKYNVTAVSEATKLSYLLGKHNWTISNDVYKCNKGQPYNTTLKLTGCKEEGEFTCDDGQCIEMKRRCDQVTGKEPNCRDESDENGCELIVFKNNYNKNTPPIADKNGTVIPANVSISITLMKVVEIEEVDHSIHLQFQISLQWNETRVKYQNLKKKTSLNALTEKDINRIWLPLIVYDNTDQKEVTRLGEKWEWGTTVAVSREEENPERSGIDEIDEIEYFQGVKNRLTMNQTYTWEFQCNYELQRYPFDTQVCQTQLILILHFASGV